MSFTKKAVQNNNSGGSTGDSVGYNEWNKYQFECFNAKAKTLPNGKSRKEKTLICKVGLIMDLGMPPAEDSKWTTKCELPVEGEKYSAEELQWKEDNKGHDFVWVSEFNDKTKKQENVRKQTSPSFPAQEYGVAIDVPQIMVDYSKHPNSTSDKPDLRPFRISLNGNFHQMYNKPIVFDGSFKPVSDKNLLYKICVAAGREQQLLDNQYDIATLVDAVCTFTIRMDLSEGDKVYLNESASKPAAVDDFVNPATDEVTTAEDQIEAVMSKDGIAPFVGILLDDTEITDDMLNILGKDTFGYVKRASTSKKFLLEGISKKTGNEYSFEKGFDYEGCAFQKAWDKKMGTDKSPTPSGATKVESKAPAKVESRTSTKVDESEPSIDFEDDVPFAPIGLMYNNMLLNVM